MRGGWNGKLLFNRYKIQVGKKKVLEVGSGDYATKSECT